MVRRERRVDLPTLGNPINPMVKTTRFRVVEAAIQASGGNMELKEEALEAAHQAEIDKIGRKIAFIKVPFAYGEDGVCAQPIA